MQSHWKPSISIKNLQFRAQLIKRLRHFFETRGVLEVETPLLYHTSVPDPTIDSFCLELPRKRYFLQTSPEFAMKRLLAAGAGPMYQLCKAFRQEESGRFHNPEFTMLEWYRPGFNHHDLMTEMDAFLQDMLGVLPCDKISYQALFEKHCDVNPHEANSEMLACIAKQHQIDYRGAADKDTWLHLLLTHVIEPHLGFEKPVMIYDFPVTQAALSNIHHERAERFEVYYRGIELANGFHELLDADVQRARFEKDNATRIALGKSPLPIDEFLLGALEAGLPPCAGVALGFDRLVMLALGCNYIQDILFS